MNIKSTTNKLLTLLLSILLTLNSSMFVYANNSSGGAITSFDKLDDEVSYQELYVGTLESDINLPSELNITLDEETSTVSVTWTSDKEFDSSVVGNTFIYTPTLNEEYVVSEDVELPTITVTIIDYTPIEKLENLINNLPEASEVSSLSEEEYEALSNILEQIEAIAEEHNIDLTTYDKYMALMGDDGKTNYAADNTVIADEATLRSFLTSSSSGTGTVYTNITITSPIITPQDYTVYKTLVLSNSTITYNNTLTVSDENNPAAIKVLCNLTIKTNDQTSGITATNNSALSVFAGGTLNIESGKFYAFNDNAVYQNEGTLNITGGKFSTSGSYNSIRKYDNQGTISISGGYYNNVGSLASYLASGYSIVNSDDSNYSKMVTSSSNIAFSIGNDKYTSLSDAIKAASDGSIIKLEKDLTLSSKTTLAIETGSKSITLDLNGKTLTASNGLEIGANLPLTIKDSSSNGKIVGQVSIISNGSLTVDSGTITSNSEGGTIYNPLGTLTVNGGTITNTNEVTDSNNSDKYNAIKLRKGTTTINGGTIESNGGVTIYVNSGANVTVQSSNGIVPDITNNKDNNVLIYNKGTLNVTDGRFKMTGTSSTTKFFYNDTNATTSITGGKYSNNRIIDNGTLPTDYTTLTNDDSDKTTYPYKVGVDDTHTEPVKITYTDGKTEYWDGTSNYVVEGAATLSITKDCTLTGQLKIGATTLKTNDFEVTIEGNNHTITSSEDESNVISSINTKTIINNLNFISNSSTLASKGNLELNNCTINTNRNAIVLQGSDQSLIINSGTYTTKNDYPLLGVADSTNSITTIKGGTFNATKQIFASGTVNVNTINIDGGSFTLTNPGKYAMFFGGNLNIKGGTFDGGNPKKYPYLHQYTTSLNIDNCTVKNFGFGITISSKTTSNSIGSNITFTNNNIEAYLYENCKLNITSTLSSDVYVYIADYENVKFGDKRQITETNTNTNLSLYSCVNGFSVAYDSENKYYYMYKDPTKLIYSTSGATITAKDRINVESFTLSLNTEDVDYTGNAYSGIKVTDNITAITGEKYTLSFEGINGTDYSASTTAPSKTGEYKVTLTLHGKSIFSTFKINEPESLKNAKNDAYTELDELVNTIKESISDNTNLNDKEKENYLASIEEAKTSIETSIKGVSLDGTNTVEEAIASVTQKLTNGKATINGILDNANANALANAKTKAKEEIEKSYEDASNKIDELDNLSDAQKEEYKKELEDKKKEATDSVNKDTTIDSIDSTKKEANSSLEKEVDKATIDDSKTEKDNLINKLKGLDDSSDVKKELLEETNKILDEASKELDKDNADLEEIMKDAQSKLDDVFDKAREEAHKHVTPGVVEITTEYKNSAPDVTLEDNSSQSEVEDKLLTDEEKVEVDNGKNAKIWLEVTDVTDTISSSDKKNITEKVDDIKSTLSSNQTISDSTYLDVSLFKQVEGQEKTPLTGTNKEVTITMVIPSDLVNTDSNISRSYRIIRSHTENGKTTIETINTNKGDNNTITFTTDKFSTYTLVYIDTKTESKDTNNKNNSSSSGGCPSNTVWSEKTKSCIYKVSNTNTK